MVGRSERRGHRHLPPHAQGVFVCRSARAGWSVKRAQSALRHRSVVGANTTDYVLDASMFVRELLNGTVKATYLVGPRGPEYRRDDQAGTIRWYVCDGLGSVVGEVAPDETLTRSQSFDVYGCVRTSSGTATTKHKFVGALGHLHIPGETEH